jgi:hypothetical protein
MHASVRREVQSDLLSVAPAGAELTGAAAQHAGRQDLGDLGEALWRRRDIRARVRVHGSSAMVALHSRYRSGP